MARNPLAAAHKFAADARAAGFTVTVETEGDEVLTVDVVKVTGSGKRITGSATWRMEDVYDSPLSGERLGFRTRSADRRAMRVWMTSCRGYDGQVWEGRSVAQVRGRIGLDAG